MKEEKEREHDYQGSSNVALSVEKTILKRALLQFINIVLNPL